MYNGTTLIFVSGYQLWKVISPVAFIHGVACKRKGYQSLRLFMPPPLGAGGIMFSGCPSVRPSVRPKPEIPSFDLHMGPLVHPTNRNHFTACPSVRPSVRPSVCPSREVSGHLPENAWRELPEILHADVSWQSSELLSLWPRSVAFSNFGAILT